MIPPTEKATAMPHHRLMPNATASENFFGDHPRVSLLMELKDRVGILHEVLKYFWKYDLNVSRIESRPVQRHKKTWNHNDNDKQSVFDFYLDFDGTLNDPGAQKLLRDLAPLTEKLLILDEKDVHWFPRHVSELDLIAHRTLDAGVDLKSDHPGFNDEEYRARRGQLAINAIQHRWDQPIPTIDYTKEETETWSAVWDRMEPLWKNYACKEYMVRSRRVMTVVPAAWIAIDAHLPFLEYLSTLCNYSRRIVDTVAIIFLNSKISRNFSSSAPTLKCARWPGC